jgi:hypothetical protein
LADGFGFLYLTDCRTGTSGGEKNIRIDIFAGSQFVPITPVGKRNVTAVKSHLPPNVGVHGYFCDNFHKTFYRKSNNFGQLSRLQMNSLAIFFVPLTDEAMITMAFAIFYHACVIGSYLCWRGEQM